MTSDEAKFILSAFRPDGSDSGNPAFADALKMAGSDPMLGSWFERSRAHDAAVAAKLREVAPPAGLREAILAGARVSGPGRGEWASRAWIAGLAAAAVVAIVIVSMKAPVRPERSGADFAGFALNDMVTGKHGGTGEPTNALIASLEANGSLVPVAERIDFETLRDSGCRTVSFAGRQVIEVCFTRGGNVFHLYVARHGEAQADSGRQGPSFVTQAAGTAAFWSGQAYDFALASKAGTEALRQLF
jgi:hypothetical protein